MTYTKRTTITIPTYRGEAIGDWMIARFLEQFGSDELITQYLDSDRKQFDKTKYVELATGMDADGTFKGVISLADYQEFLDNLYKNLPSKYRKTGSEGKPGFKNVVPIVDMGMGPFTFESANKLAAESSVVFNKK